MSPDAPPKRASAKPAAPPARPVASSRPAPVAAPTPVPAPVAPSPPPAAGHWRGQEWAVDTPSARGHDFVRSVYEVARKEVLQHIRTKRLLIIGVVVALLLGMVTLVFGPGVTRNLPDDAPVSKEHTVLLFYFAVGLIGGLQFTQLLAIILTGDAVCSEWSNRTIFLLLSKPVSRQAFVLGKFLGSAFTVAASLAVLFTLDYVAMQPFYAGSPSSEEVAGFFKMLGVVVLGATAFSALALFFSTLTRSTATSIILALSAWLIVFPVIGNVGFFAELGKGDQADLTSDSVDAWRYLNPAADMQAGARLVAPTESDVEEAVLALNIFQTAPDHVDTAIWALIGHTVLWLALALAVVQRRNFE